ncbi:hypothetical protein Lal_00014672 [Lupinus albus]|nr:hypothetical protein Lal_00014672 [Lupinus albus]
MGSQGKKRVRIESFTSSQALEQESKLLDLGNALLSHLSSILNLKCVWGFPRLMVGGHIQQPSCGAHGYSLRSSTSLGYGVQEIHML